MKKVISLALITIMLLACIPLGGTAAVSDSDVAKVGATGYANLDDAIVAALKGYGDIVLLKDASFGLKQSLNDTISPNEDRTFTIYGQNHTLTVSKPLYTGSHNITFSNMNIVMNDTIDQSGRGNVTFDSCTVNIASTSNIRHTGTGDMTFKNTTVTNNLANCPVLYLRGEQNCKSTITIDGSTLIEAVGATNSIEGNSAVIQTNQLWDSKNNKYVVTAMDYTIRLINGSVLKNNATGQENQKPRIMRIEQNTTTVSIYADNDCKLILAPKATAFTDSGYISVNGSNGINNGSSGTKIANVSMYGTPQFIAEPNALKKTVYLPRDVYNPSVGLITSDSIAANGFQGFRINGSSSISTNQTIAAGTYSSTTTVVPVAKAVTYVAKIGNTSYATLVEAIQKSRNNDIINLLSNCSLGYADITDTKTVTVEGNGKTVSHSGGYFRFGKANIAFKNLTLNATEALEINDTGNATFIGATVNLNVANGRNGTFRVVGTGRYLFRDSVVNGNTPITMFYLRTNSTSGVMVDHSTIVQRKGAASAHLGNNSVFHFVNLADYNVPEMVYTMTFLNGAVIKNESVADSGSKAAALFVSELDANKMTIKMSFDDSCTMELASKSTALELSEFIGKIGKLGSPNVQISGVPKYTATPYTVSKGVTLFDIGGTVWRANGEALEGLIYKKSGLTQDTMFIFGQLTPQMANKAGISTEGQVGIYFIMEFSDEILHLAGGKATYGILISPQSYVYSDLDKTMDSKKYIEVTAAPTDVRKAGSVNQIKLGIKNITVGADAYPECLDLIVRGYVAYEDENGQNVIIYTNNTVTTSIYDVALGAYNGGKKDSAVINSVLGI